MLGVFFFCAFAVIGSDAWGCWRRQSRSEPRAHAPGAVISASRADIVDRNGVAPGHQFRDPRALCPAETVHDRSREMAAKKLVEIFPDLNEERLIKDFTGQAQVPVDQEENQPRTDAGRARDW